MLGDSKGWESVEWTIGNDLEETPSVPVYNQNMER